MDELRSDRDYRDPTLLTTQQLLREMGNLKEVVFTRLDGMDRAIVIFNENLTRVPTDTDKQVQQLKELHEGRLEGMDKAIVLRHATLDEDLKNLEKFFSEKFGSIQLQFRERDVRTDSSKAASDIALAAALQAQKEAVGEQNKSSTAAIQKSELATAKQIDSLVASIQQVIKNADEKFQDLKDRITRVEGNREGGGNMIGYIVGAVGVLIAITSLALHAMGH